MADDSQAFELIAVGGGAAGLVSAALAAGLGVKAAQLKPAPAPHFDCGLGNIFDFGSSYL